MTFQLAILGGKPLRQRPFHTWPVYGSQEQQALIDTLNSGRWGKNDGTQVKRFEKRFAEYHHAKHAIAVVNGTVALRIALSAIGIQPGDEVIVPPYTFIATATSVIEANGVPIFVDIETDTLNLDPDKIEAAITNRTRAIIPVHFAGLAADMDRIMDIAERHNLFVIEDACHAHGAELNGRKLGSIGHLGCFSFQSSKNLTAGEGGIIISNDDKLAGKCWSIHNCGRYPDRKWYEHFNIGGNYRMGEFQGAILNCQLDRLEQQTNTRIENALYLAEKIKNIPGIDTQHYDPNKIRHSYHLFMIRYQPDLFGLPHHLFLKTVNAEGIPLSQGYPVPIYRQPIFQDRHFDPFVLGMNDVEAPDYNDCSCPVTEAICAEQGYWLIHHIFLGSKQDMDDIAAAFQKVFDSRMEVLDNIHAIPE